MSNKVQIGVDANVSGVEASLNKVEAGAADVSKSFGDIGKATEKAAAGIGKVEYSAKRLQAIAAILHKEFGKVFDPKQAEAFIRNFDSIRNNKHVSGSSKLRAFNSFESWHAGNGSMFVNPSEAERYKRRVFGLAGSGLGLPTPSGGHGGGGGGGVPPTPGERNNSAYGGMASRGMSGMGKVAGAGLALAGIGTVMAMAGRAVDLAKQEATSTDQLLRKSGDLTQSFDGLREKVRLSGEGLGVLYTEAAQLGKQYVETANGDGGDIRGNLRTGFGLSRAYGLELGEGVGFMAQMRHQGQMKPDDKDGRRFALLIGEAIEKGQTTGKAGEVLQAVSSFSSQVARLALSPANIHGFGGALAGLTASGDIGMKGDPSNAAALLMNVDSSIRRGGNMGEASLNFQYGALSRQMPGLDPIMAKAIMEQGAFGSGVSSSIKTYAGRNGIKLPEFSKSDNLSIMMDEMDKQYGNSSLKLDAIKNHFGLGSYGQAAALANLDRKELSGLSGAMGDNIGSLSASGIQGAAKISVANDEQLKAIADKLSQRKDLTDTERGDIKSKLADGDMKGLREVMLKAVSVREQEKNVGTETRDAVNALHNTLTDIGGVVLPAITAIQDGVVAMARALAPESDYAKSIKLQEGVADYKARKADLLAGHQKQLVELGSRLDARGIDGKQREDAMGQLKQLHEAEIYKFTRENDNYEDFINKDKSGGGGGAGSVVDGMRRRNSQLTAPQEPLDLGSTPAAAVAGPGGDLMSAVIGQESGGRHLGRDGRLLTSGAGARGIAQIMPGTGGDPGYGVRPLQNDSEEEHRRFGSDYLAAMMKEFGGDKAKALAAYNAGPGAVQKSVRRNGDAWLQYMPKETQDYVPSVLERERRMNKSADSFSGGVPSGNPAGSPAQTQKIELTLEGMMRDSQHQQVADIAQIQHTISIPTAAGATG